MIRRSLLIYLLLIVRLIVGVLLLAVRLFFAPRLGFSKESVLFFVFQLAAGSFNPVAIEKPSSFGVFSFAEHSSSGLLHSAIELLLIRFLLLFALKEPARPWLLELVLRLLISSPRKPALLLGRIASPLSCRPSLSAPFKKLGLRRWQCQCDKQTNKQKCVCAFEIHVGTKLKVGGYYADSLQAKPSGQEAFLF